MSNRAEQPPKDELDLDRMERTRDDYVHKVFEIEKILNEKFLYVQSGTLALLLAGISTDDQDINWIIIIGVVCLVMSLILYFILMMLSVWSFQSNIDTLDYNYVNYYNEGGQKSYNSIITCVSTVLQIVMFLLFFLGIISIATYYLTT